MRSGTGRNFRKSQIAHFMYNIFSENRAAYDNVKKYGRARQATDNTTVSYVYWTVHHYDS